MGGLTSNYNLIEEPWLPVRRGNGRVAWIRPWEITQGIDGNPAVEPAWSRPDLDLATEEFLIGLLSTAAAPDNEEQWDEWQHNPPTVEQLREAFSKVACAFNLRGDGPRFMQDMDPLKIKKAEGKEDKPVEGKPVAGLFVDAPGEQTREKNTDLFMHRDNTPQFLGCPAAAIALFALQAYAPSGGTGHRTSLRGGGPMTTLLRAEGPYAETLWGRIWPNVETKEQQRARAVGDSLNQPIFPWMAATRTSEKKGGVATTPADAHPLQVYWSMPRRIRLQFEAAEGLACELTREDALDGVVTEYRTVNYGVNYSDGFTHPLSPYYRKKADDPWLPVHPQPQGISYRLWPDCVGMSADATGKRPAQTVRHWYEERGLSTPARLRVAGYDMDSMKPRNWVEGEMPIYRLSDAVQRERLERLALQMVEAAALAAGQLAGQVKAAVSGPSLVRLRLDRHTEADFYAALARARQALEAVSDVPLGDFRVQWKDSLAEAAIALFDERAPLDGGDVPHMQRRAQARKNLIFWLRGYGKGRKFFSTLELTPPKPKKRSDKE